MGSAPRQGHRRGGQSKNWLDYHAKWPNAWAMAVASLDLSGAEARVLMYVVARTWGDYDGRRQRFGRTCVALSSSEVGRAINMEASSVRRARASLIKRGALSQFCPPAGRRATAIGPGPLLRALAPDRDENDGQPQSLEATMATLSPKLREAVERGRTVVEQAEA